MSDGYKRIMIIGKPGSGKTVFADRLGKISGREVIHLDKHYWKSGWVKAYASSEQFREKVRELISGNEWVLDGNFKNSIDIRLERADTVVFFDFPVWRSIFGAYKRWFFGVDNPIDKHPGMRERVSLELLKMMIFYPSRTVTQKLNDTQGKKIIIVKNRKDAEDALQEIVSSLKVPTVPVGIKK